MPRQKKSGTYINIKMEQKIFDLLTQYCEKTGIPKTRVIEKAVQAYLQERTGQDSDVTKP